MAAANTEFLDAKKYPKEQSTVMEVNPDAHSCIIAIS